MATGSLRNESSYIAKLELRFSIFNLKHQNYIYYFKLGRNCIFLTRKSLCFQSSLSPLLRHVTSYLEITSFLVCCPSRSYTAQEWEVCFSHLCCAWGRRSITSVGWIGSGRPWLLRCLPKDPVNEESDVTASTCHWAGLEHRDSSGPTQGCRTVCL